MKFNPDDPGYAEDEIVKLSPPTWKNSYQNFASRPCFRDTILWSLNLGFLAALDRFMITSSVSKAIVFGTGSLSVSLCVVYAVCRFRQIRKKIEIYQLEPALRGYAEIYGTDRDKGLSQDNK